MAGRSSAWQSQIRVDEADAQQHYTGSIDDDDLPHGRGTMRYCSGARAGNAHAGWWQHGVKHGPGTYTWSCGDTYTGHFSDDAMRGYGVLTHADGSRFGGFFVDGVLHGRGAAQLASGDCYEGEYDCGFAHGRGIASHVARGGTYWGAFVMGQRHGRGLWTDANGHVEAREYVDGGLVAASLGACIAHVARVA